MSDTLAEGFRTPPPPRASNCAVGVGFTAEYERRDSLRAGDTFVWVGTNGGAAAGAARTEHTRRRLARISTKSPRDASGGTTRGSREDTGSRTSPSPPGRPSPRDAPPERREGSVGRGSVVGRADGDVAQSLGPREMDATAAAAAAAGGAARAKPAAGTRRRIHASEFADEVARTAAPAASSRPARVAAAPSTSGVAAVRAVRGDARAPTIKPASGRVAVPAAFETLDGRRRTGARPPPRPTLPRPRRARRRAVPVRPILRARRSRLSRKARLRCDWGRTRDRGKPVPADAAVESAAARA